MTMVEDNSEVQENRTVSRTISSKENADKILSEDSKSTSTLYTLDGTLDWNGQQALRSTTGRWPAAKYIIGEQLFVNLAWFGVAKNLVMYLTTVMHQGNAQASNFVSNWTGTVYIVPLLGAFIADSYCGRYLTTLVFSVLLTVGMTLVSLAAYEPSMYPPQCPTQDFHCQQATSSQTLFLTVGLYITAIASGCLQSPVTALGADQFDELDDVEKKQKSSFFNWFYQAITVGAMIAAIVIVTVQQQVSWGLGMALSAGPAFIGLGLFLIGSRIYRVHKPGGNALARVAQVFVASARNWKAKSKDPNQLHESDYDREGSFEGRRILHTKAFRFLDKAAVETDDDITTNTEGAKTTRSWRLCTVTQVEEVKCFIRLCPIFLTSVLYTTVYMQLSTLFVVQGATMDTRIVANIKIAPASLSVIENVSVTFWVVVYDQLLVPLVRRYTKHPRGFTDLQRMGIGLGLSVIAMVVAAVVEMERLSMAKQYGLLDDPGTPIPMSVLWEIPQYFIIGASEIFTYIGLMEFFYDQSPDALRSVGTAFSLLTNGIGSYISTALVTVVNNVTSRGGEYSRWIPDNLNRGHVDRFYWLLALLSLVNLLAFGFCSKYYTYLKQEPFPERKKESVLAYMDMTETAAYADLVVIPSSIDPRSSLRA